MSVSVRGATKEERDQSRAKRTRLRRAATYQQELANASRPAGQVVAAVRYLRAVADDRCDSDQSVIAAAVVAIANEWNKKP